MLGGGTQRIYLDHSQSSLEAIVAHYTQVIGVGVGDVGEEQRYRRSQELCRVVKCADQHRAGGQHAEDGVADAQAQVLPGHAPDKEALQGEGEQEDGAEHYSEDVLVMGNGGKG